MYNSYSCLSKGCLKEAVVGDYCESCYKYRCNKGILDNKVIGTLNTLDSKKGIKHDSDKPRLELLDPDFLTEVAKVMTFGAKKYEANNWRKGLEVSRCLGACLRHVLAVVKGEDKDPESGMSHMAHATCCLMFVYTMLRTRPELDDRYKPEGKI